MPAHACRIALICWAEHEHSLIPIQSCLCHEVLLIILLSIMSSNNNNLSNLAAAAAAVSVVSSQSASSSLVPTSTSTSFHKPLVLPQKHAASIGPLQWNGANYVMDGITREDIHDHDVLSGRGGASNNHPGNEAFRQLVNKVKVDYLQCPKREKPLLAMRIVQAVRAQSPPGRFLQHDKSTDTWKDVGDTKAREKTSQALREGAPIIRDMVHKPAPSTLPAVLKQVKKEERKREPTKKSDCTFSHNVVHSSNSNLPSKHSSGTPPSSGMSPLSVESVIKPYPSCMNFPTHHQTEEHRINAHHPTFKTQCFYHPQHSVDSRIAREVSAAVRNEPPPVPFEIVRGLLLGHIDPVTVAANILSREEAAIVAYRHQLNARPLTEIIHEKKHLLEAPASAKPMDRDQTGSIESLELARIPSSSSSDQSEPKERLVKSPKQQKSQRRAPLKKRRIVVEE